MTNECGIKIDPFFKWTANFWEKKNILWKDIVLHIIYDWKENASLNSRIQFWSYSLTLEFVQFRQFWTNFFTNSDFHICIYSIHDVIRDISNENSRILIDLVYEEPNEYQKVVKFENKSRMTIIEAFALCAPSSWNHKLC